MKKIFFKIITVSFAVLLASCSSNDRPVEEPEVIVPPVEIPDVLTTQNVRTYMVDGAATDETVALFYNLKKLSKTKFAIGQQDAFNSFYKDVNGDSDIKKTTGNDPALLGSDFMFITDKNNPSNSWFVQQENKIIADTKAAYAKGMINIFSWHIREPNDEDSFYTSEMSDQVKATAFKSILPGGANHDWYKLKLDKLASVISNLKDVKGILIPVIFRPFHEFDGNWFWWGANYSTPEEYKTAFKFTVDYLKNTKGVHNILYAFSPDNSNTNAAGYLSRYPGDTYVDILAMDNYGDLNNQGQAGADKANAKLKIISDLAKTKVKIAALSETGYRVTVTDAVIPNWFSTYLYSALTDNEIEIAFVMFWNNNKDGYYVPTPSASNAADFKTFSSKSKAALINKLPNMYVLPK